MVIVSSRVMCICSETVINSIRIFKLAYVICNIMDQ